MYQAKLAGQPLAASYSIQSVVDAIMAENPALSENMAHACALVAMAKFRERLLKDEKETPSSPPENSRVPH
jgi:hypothetical protein